MVRVRDLHFRRRPGYCVEFDRFGLFVLSEQQLDAVAEAVDTIKAETADANETVTGSVHVSGANARIVWDDPDRDPLGPTDVTPEAV